MSVIGPKNSPRQLMSIAAKGFCMGAADVVPGVSGGTMAFILGIYQRLLDAIKAFDLATLRLITTARFSNAAQRVDLLFLLALGLGILSALLVFTRVIPLPVLIRTHPELIYGLFFGLIVASVAVLVRELGQMRAGDIGAMAIGVIFGAIVINLVPTETPENSWFVFLAAALAICAMILPGISGSFILLILQKYAYIFDAIGRLDFNVIVPFALGAATGLLLFSRVLSWLLATYYRPTLLMIIGVLVASLWKIWPFQDRIYEIVRNKERLMGSSPTLPHALDTTTLGAIALAVTGFIAVLLIQWLANRNSSNAA
jgi:putative membrane protein